MVLDSVGMRYAKLEVNFKVKHEYENRRTGRAHRRSGIGHPLLREGRFAAESATRREWLPDLQRPRAGAPGPDPARPEARFLAGCDPDRGHAAGRGAEGRAAREAGRATAGDRSP